MSRPSALPHFAFVVASTLAIAALHLLGNPTFWPDRELPGSWPQGKLKSFVNRTAAILSDTSHSLAGVEAAAGDAIASLGRKAPVDPSLVFLAIDAESMSVRADRDLNDLSFLDAANGESRKALETMAGDWPWSREVYALVLERLMSAGARAVIFDVTYPNSKPEDEVLRNALERHRDKVVVAGHIDDATVSTFIGPAPSLLPETEPRDARIGFDNWWPDSDNIIRRSRYRWALEHGVWQSNEELSLAARALQKIGKGGLIPQDRELHRFRFAGASGAFPARSLYRIFVPSYWAQNYDNGEFFRNKVIFIGAAGPSLHDEHPTPFGTMPGAELQINAVNAALHGAFVTELPLRIQTALILAAGLLAWLASNWIGRPYVRLSLLIAATLGGFGAAYFCYEFADLIVPSIAPLLALNLSGVFGLTRDILHERREKTRFRNTLERYVSHNVVDELLIHRDQYTRVLGGGVRPVAILFSDIRGFSKVAASMEPHALVADLNDYFSAMVDCVFRHDGTLDKFIGDAVMAVWGNARSKSATEDVRAAVTCAREMREELVRLNSRRTAAGKPELHIGIGLNFGEVIVGNIGSPSRMEFTVIGEAVNVAWRLQELTKGVGTDVILGERLCQLLGSDVATGPLENAELPGYGSFTFARLLATEGQTAATRK